MTDYAKRLGYGGSAVISDGSLSRQVLITSGSLSTETSPAYLEPLDIKPVDPGSGTSRRSQVLHADGTESYTGELSVDVTDNFLDMFAVDKLLARRYSFDVGIHDGENDQEMRNCYATSVSISGSTGGIINASVSFISSNAPDDTATVENSFARAQEPLGYWYTGNTDVRDWSFEMSQNVEPVFTNNTASPRYLRAGLVSYSLSVTTFSPVTHYDEIQIKTRVFTLTGKLTSNTFSYGGSTELGTYEYNFESSADAATGSDDQILSVSTI